MSKIYAIIGSNSMTVVADEVKYNPATNEVLMKSERPEGDFIANEEGDWVKPVPSIDEQLDVLDTQYNENKETLRKAYQDALMYGDNDRVESIRADLVALDEQYDADYEAIVGESEDDDNGESTESEEVL